MAGGVASNIVVTANNGKDSNGHGAYVGDGGLLVDSLVTRNNRNLATGQALHRSYAGALNIGSGGEVRNTRIADNINGASTFCSGGGVFINGGTLRSSVVSGNINHGSSGSEGGGISLREGLAANCLVVSNALTHHDASRGGGGVYQTGGAVIHCTVAFNSAAVGNFATTQDVDDLAGGLQSNGGVVSNSIVHGNTRIDRLTACDIRGQGDYTSRFHHSCSTDLPGVERGNIGTDSRFRDPSTGDFSLRLDSPCIDAAGDLGLTTDLAGAARNQDGDADGSARPDIGAFEVPSAGGALRCHFTVDQREAFTGEDFGFSAVVRGDYKEGLYYHWNFGNGQAAGVALAAVSRSFAAVGAYDVSLMVSNSIAEVAFFTWPGAVRVGVPLVYVSPGGGDIVPYDTWEKAATTIQAAVKTAVDTGSGATLVLVADGLYRVRSSSEVIYLGRGILIESVNGPLATIVEGIAGADVFPNFILDHPAAVVDGFTSQKANFGAIIARGTLRNAILRNNSGDSGRGSDSGYGAGLRMFGGVAEWCQIITNTLTASTGVRGAGVWMTGPSLLRNSTVSQNRIYNIFAAGGAGIACSDPQSRPVVRNCLVAGNLTGSSGAYPSVGGSGVLLQGGHLESCTVVANRIEGLAHKPIEGGGVHIARGSVYNSIVWHNVIATNGLPEALNDVSAASIGKCFHSAAPWLETAGQGNVAVNPRFAAHDEGDWRLVHGSPCINTGVNQDWMATSFDLDGLHRISTRTVDMGAYEYAPPIATLFLLR